MLYSRKFGSIETLQALGFLVAEGADEPIECVRVAWSEAAAAEFSRISALAALGDGEANETLPYSSLRALLAAGLPNPLFLRSDLALRAPRDDGDRDAFSQCDGTEGECETAVATAMRSWCAGPLKRWSERRGLPDDVASALVSLARSRGLVTTSRRTVDLLSADIGGSGFPDVRDIVHAAAVRRIAGRELFEGLGPVRVLVRSHARDNTVSFLTFPKAVNEGSWSMRARLTVETLPGQPRAFVRLDVSRVRWCPKVPSGMPFTQKNLSASVFGPDERRAVHFGVAIHRGKVKSPEDPSYAMAALRAGVDPGEDFASHVAAGPRNGSFVGIPYAPSYDPAPTVATGATELDWTDCFDAVARAMEGILEPLEVWTVPTDRRVSRNNEDIPALKAATVLEEIARTLGHNDIDDDAIADAWRVLHGDDLPKGLSVPAKAAEAAARFDELRSGNTARARAVFESDIPAIVVLSASASEGAAVAEVVRTLFAGRMRVENRLIPEGTHGARRDLEAADRKARDRFEARVAAWKPLAESLAAEFSGARVLVHAAKFRDDPVNKIAGRIALARYGDCNVQYLDARGRKADEWFFRIQAAVLDLMFGHSGLVSPIARNVAEAFPDAETRPKTVIGVSVVAKSRTASASAASFFLSVSIDVETGQASATAARPKDGTLDHVGPAPFFEVLKAVASWDGSSIGSGEAAKADFQDFVDGIVAGACQRGERPLVLFDGAHGRNLWPTLSNKGFSGPHTIVGRPLDIASDWPGARLVRIQDTIEPTVVTRKARTFVEIDPSTGRRGTEIEQSAPTLTEAGRLVRLAGGVPNYVSSGDLDGTQKIAKGLSVYRRLPQYKQVAAEEVPRKDIEGKLYGTADRDLTGEPYKLPGVIGILVLHTLPGDDPDRIAGLCHGLRAGFGHSRSPARMPAPLFQARKVAEYIPAYVLDEVNDGADGPAETVVDADADEASAEDEASVEASSTDQVPETPAAVDPAWETPAVANPLLLLARGARVRKSSGGIMNFSPSSLTATLPLVGAIASPLNSGLATEIPEELLAKAGGDDLLERMLRLHWVGPVPEDVASDGFFVHAASLASLKARQLIAAAIERERAPLTPFLPVIDPRSEESFRDFLLFLVNIGDGLNFAKGAVPRASRQKTRRWIFNGFYESFFWKLKSAYKPEPSPGPEALAKNPIGFARLLQTIDEGLVARRYFVIESLFMNSEASGYAAAAASMAVVHPEWAPTAAYCARVAKFVENRGVIRELWAQYTERALSDLPMDFISPDQATDASECERLERIPSTLAPAFVEAAWLRDKVSLNGAFRSHLHAHRQTFNASIGDGSFWPDDKPSAEIITTRVARLFSVPAPVLGAVAKRDRESIFRPFYRKIESTLRAMAADRVEQAFTSDWEDNGGGPAIFVILANGGYRRYASDFAVLRAIENPSVSLERVVRDAGEEFSEIAEFVKARRRAALWFACNAPEADDAPFSAFVSVFDRGDRDPPAFGMHEAGTDASAGSGDTDSEVSEIEEDEVVTMESAEHDVPTLAPTNALPDEEVLDVPALLSRIERAAAEGSTLFHAGDFDGLDDALAAVRSSLDSAWAAASALPRLVSNEPLVRRAEDLSQAAGTASQRIGDISLPPLPPVGQIRLPDAEAAERALLQAAIIFAKVEEAFITIEALGARVATGRFTEISARISEGVADAQRGLEETVASLATAVAHLLPEPQADDHEPPTRPEAQADQFEDQAFDRAPDTAPESRTEVGSQEAGGVATDKSDTDDVAGTDASAEIETFGERRDPVPEFPIVAPSLGASPAPADEDEDEDVDFDAAALDRLAATVEPAAASDPSPEPDGAEPENDREDDRINQALDRFVDSGHHSFAYNLALAAEAEGRGDAINVTSDEVRLAALAGQLNHTALLARVEVLSSWVQSGFKAFAAIEADEDHERAAARLLPVMPLILELGVFFPASGAGELLRSFGSLPGDLGQKAQAVFESVARIRHTNLAFTRAMLANVANELDCSKAMTAARHELLRKSEQFATMKFDFQLGNKIRAELNRSEGVVGRLHAQLAKGVDDAATAAAVSEFTTNVADRSRVIQMLVSAEEEINDRVRGVDGVARDRFVSFFGDFHNKATAYLDFVGEVDAARHEERPKVRDFAKEISRALEAMIAAVEAAAADQGRIGTAARNTAPKLRKVAGILSGEPGTPAPSDMQQVIHAEMALIPELDFGRSWLPSPYEPARIVDLLCDLNLPILPADGEERAAVFEEIVRQRIGRNSYVGARMLLDATGFLGVSDTVRSSLAGDLETNLQMATQSLHEECGQVRRAVERVIRFGSLRQSGEADVASDLLDRVDKIEGVQVPVDIDADGRSEAVDPVGIYDVSVAIEVLEDVKAASQSLLDEPRAHLLRRIDTLAADGADPTLVDRLRHLCQSDDLLTAEEFIDEATQTGLVPESRSRNWRFDEFSRIVLPALAKRKQDIGSDISAALRLGEDIDTIRYGALTQARRDESVEIVDMWRELFRRLTAPHFSAHFSMFLDRIGIEADMRHLTGGATAQRRLFWGDFKVRIALDQESLLLPDFGSRTDGWYRIAISQSMPGEATIADLCGSAGTHGVILFVGDAVSLEQRHRFYVRNIEGKRRILLVDSAILYYALAEPALRPLTLLELAQPYSYVAPYHDWGRDAVPPEMFVGRHEDIGHILDTEGSCIVYGGRRMGKTAILRHLRNTRHDAPNGMLVAFVDAQDLGKGPTPTKKIWAEIAAALPEIFEKVGSVTDGKRVSDLIERWLREDARRRVILLIDECDQFVVADAQRNYVEFLALQKLMTETRRRFKFVLSGLSDVTRLVQTGNPPLKQISGNPRRIGSLTGSERKDAEDLVLRPFAAIGVMIARTDVWRILSHANYYPVLIQTYAERLLQMISDRVRATQKPIREVSSDLVAEVMEDRKVREEIKRIFQFTLGIDLRYRLIAYVVASLVLEAEAEGRMADGFRTREIRDLSLFYWEAGFQDKNRFSLFDDLLDEMEGLGIVRRVSDDRWTLRSSAVVRLLGNRDEVDTAISEFIDMKAPTGFDPRSHRRILPVTKGVLTERRSSPLTLGQEHEILQSSSRATFVVGNGMSDYALVPLALKSAPDSFSNGAAFDIRFLTPHSGAALIDSLKEIRAQHGKKVIVVVAHNSPWTADWVRSAIQAKNVAKGSVRVVFVGGAEHATSVIGDKQLSTLTAHVAQVALEPWSTAYFQDMVTSNNSVALSHRFEQVAQDNGGWNAPMWQLFKSGKAAQRGETIALTAEAVGMVGKYGEAMRVVAVLHGDSSLSATDIDEYCGLDDELKALNVSGQAVVDYGIMMGLLVTAPGRPQADERKALYRLSAQALAVAIREKAAA